MRKIHFSYIVWWVIVKTSKAQPMIAWNCQYYPIQFLRIFLFDILWWPCMMSKFCLLWFLFQNMNAWPKQFSMNNTLINVYIFGDGTMIWFVGQLWSQTRVVTGAPTSTGAGGSITQTFDKQWPHQGEKILVRLNMFCAIPK